MKNINLPRICRGNRTLLSDGPLGKYAEAPYFCESVFLSFECSTMYFRYYSTELVFAHNQIRFLVLH